MIINHDHHQHHQSSLGCLGLCSSLEILPCTWHSFSCNTITMMMTIIIFIGDIAMTVMMMMSNVTYDAQSRQLYTSISNVQPVRWVMYLAPGRRQLKLRLRRRRRKSQVVSTDDPKKRGIFIQLMKVFLNRFAKIKFISIYEAKKHLSFLTVVIGVDRNVSEVAKYEIELPSLSSRVFQVPYSISHNHLWKDGDDDDDNDVISESFQ